MSGRTPAWSQAERLPVRPHPVITSSAMNSTPYAEHRRRNSARTAGEYMSMPPAPSTNGSTMSAAG